MRRRTASSVFWQVSQNGGRRLITLAVFLAMARLLGPEDFGLVALAGSAIAFIELFTRVGFAEAIVQRDNLEDAHLDTAFWSTLGMGIVFALLSIGMAVPMSIWFDSPEMIPVMQWLSLNIVLLSLTRVQSAILRRDFKFRKLAIRTLIASVCGGVVGVVMAFNGMGVWALVAQQLVDATIGVIVLWASSSWRPSLVFSRSHFRDLYGFGINVMGVQVMHFLNQHAGRLIIGFFLGTVALGLYSVGQRFILIIQQVSGLTFQTAMFSTFSRMQTDLSRLQSSFITSTRLVVLIVFPLYLFLVAAGQEIVVVVFGEKWESSGGIVKYLAFAGFIMAISMFHDSVFRAAGKPEYSLRISIANSLLGVGLILIAIRHGIEAVAFTAIVRAAAVLPYSFQLINRIFPMSFGMVVNQLRAPLIGSLALVLAIFFTNNYLGTRATGVEGVVLMGLFGFGAYGITLLIVDRNLFFEALDSARMVFARGGKKRQ